MVGTVKKERLLENIHSASSSKGSGSGKEAFVQDLSKSKEFLRSIDLNEAIASSMDFAPLGMSVFPFPSAKDHSQKMCRGVLLIYHKRSKIARRQM